MTRLRIVLSSVVLASALAACSDSPEPATPSAGGQAPASAVAPSAGLPAAAPTEAQPWQLDLPPISAAETTSTLARGRQALASGQLERGASPGPGALELFLAVAHLDPANEAAKEGLRDTLAKLRDDGLLRIRDGDLRAAERIATICASVLPDDPGLPDYRKSLQQGHRADALVKQANAQAAKGRLLAPAHPNAFELLQRARVLVPGYAPAQRSLTYWYRERLKAAWIAASAENFHAADIHLIEANRLQPGLPEARVMDLRIIELRQALTDALLVQGNAAVDKLALDQADRSLAHVAGIAAQSAGVDALRERIDLARHYGPFKPAQAFAETLAAGGSGPEMVVVPHGAYVMGSSEHEALRSAAESPVHIVRFARGFAIARNELTIADFRRFIAASGYRTLATREGRSTVYDEKGGLMSEHADVDWRRDDIGRVAAANLPVMHIAFEDAQAYAAWLSKQTGQHYRLPSEAEFEYVLRAGSLKKYPWGDAPPDRLVGNLTGDGDQSLSGRRWANAIPGYRDGFWGTAPVRSFVAEKFGTYDMIGNLSEWTLDCWHDSYQRAPDDGSAWINPGCAQRVVRGASWDSSLDQARSAFRLPMDANSTSARLGFRVVREL